MLITAVHKDELGGMLGLKPGSRLLKINGKRVIDELDYKFRMSSSEVEIEVELDGKRQVFEIEKEIDTDLGVIFEELKIRKCANDCVFCFVDQNPEGMRQGMYFRDGDYRLSFLYGHFITMTNMGQNELNRIVEQKLSPLYISVHTTDPQLRKELLLYKRNDNLLEKINFLIKNGIELHAQVVLMPDKNDKNYLRRTIEDLYQFYPDLGSLSIVPVGLTAHREGLPELKTVDRKYAEFMVDSFEKLKTDFPGSDSNQFLYLSDEWYILANIEIPDSEAYGNLDLIENGVGQVREFLDRFESDKREILNIAGEEKLKFSIGTGTLAYPVFNEYVKPFLDKNKQWEIDIFPIVNNFYGEMVTVAGLLTGKDILNQLKNRDLGNEIWFSNRILNDDQTVTLDDFTLDDLSEKLKTRVNVCKDSILEIFQRSVRH